MKKLKIAGVVVLITAIVYFGGSAIFRSYACNSKEFNYLNQQYTKYDYSNSSFVPFGADNSWYNSDLEYQYLFGLSFLKSDTNRNFVYINDALGTTIYKRNDYNVPKFPEVDYINELIMICDENEQEITITDEKDIEIMADYLSQLEVSANEQTEKQLVFYAVSKKLGGVYQLNKSGSIYLTDNNEIKYGYIITGDLPEEIQEKIKVWLETTNQGTVRNH